MKTVEQTAIVSCRAYAGATIATSSPWEAGKPVQFIYAPAGLHTITAGFRQQDVITLTLEVDEQTAADLQASYAQLVKGSKQEPYGDEDHEARKATLRFPKDVTRFTWGSVNGEPGVVVAAAPTGYGAGAVNGKDYRSWSPEFGTDADYSKATCLKCSKPAGECECERCHFSFPDGVRGSLSNPARITACNFCMGALTNKPAFQAMPPVKAKQAGQEGDTVKAGGTSEGAKKGWEHRGYTHAFVHLDTEGHAHIKPFVSEDAAWAEHSLARSIGGPKRIAIAKVNKGESAEDIAGKVHRAWKPLSVTLHHPEGHSELVKPSAKATDASATAETVQAARPGDYAFSLDTVRQKVTEAAHVDPRFDTDSHGFPEGSPEDLRNEPECTRLVIWQGGLQAVIRTDDGRQLRVPIAVAPDGKVTFTGEATPTEQATVYSTEVEVTMESVKASGTSEGVRKSWDARRDAGAVAMHTDLFKKHSASYNHSDLSKGTTPEAQDSFAASRNAHESSAKAYGTGTTEHHQQAYEHHQKAAGLRQQAADAAFRSKNHAEAIEHMREKHEHEKHALAHSNLNKFAAFVGSIHATTATPPANTVQAAMERLAGTPHTDGVHAIFEHLANAQAGKATAPPLETIFARIAGTPA